MSNNFDRFIQCAIVKDNNNSTLKNWLLYQYKQVKPLLIIGALSIAGVLLVILDAKINGGL